MFQSCRGSSMPGTEPCWHITCCQSTPAGFWSHSLYQPPPQKKIKIKKKIYTQPSFLAVWWESRWSACLFAFPRLPLFTECFSRAQIVRAVLPSPHLGIHASAWCYMPSDLRRSLTRSSIRWLLLVWLFTTGTVARARRRVVYSLKLWRGSDLFGLLDESIIILTHYHIITNNYDIEHMDYTVVGYMIINICNTKKQLQTDHLHF